MAFRALPLLALLFALPANVGACSSDKKTLPPIDTNGTGKPPSGGAGAETPTTPDAAAASDDSGIVEDSGDLVGEAGPCGTATCPHGCCSNAGVCEPGTQGGACGANGTQCQNCGGGGTCGTTQFCE